MTIRCPACGRRVSRKHIDVPADRVVCRHCGKVASYLAISGVSGISGGPGAGRAPGAIGGARARAHAQAPAPLPQASVAADPGSPPPGAWYRDDGVTMTVGGHTRSIGGGIALMLICVFWLGVDAMFLFGSLVTIFNGLGFSTGQAGFGSLAGGLFMLFVSLLFGLGGWFLLCTSAMLLGGRVEFTLRGDELRAFSGVANMGKRHVFSAAAIAAIEEDVRTTRTKNGTATTRTILVRQPPGKDVRVGPMLNDPRRGFVLGVLKQVVGR